jgi:hypothetical protein
MTYRSPLLPSRNYVSGIAIEQSTGVIPRGVRHVNPEARKACHKFVIASCARWPDCFETFDRLKYRTFAYEASMLLRCCNKALTAFLAGALLSVTALSVDSGPAMAEARQAEKFAAQVPADVIEVQSIGTWTQDKQAGIYRTVTIISGADKEYAARVFVQWLAIKGDSGRAEIVATAPLVEFNNQRMPMATVTIDADTDNEASIVVTAQDSDTHRDTVMMFKATKPGTYRLVVSPANPAKLSGATVPSDTVRN